jgi:hypothetical protein
MNSYSITLMDGYKPEAGIRRLWGPVVDATRRSFPCPGRPDTTLYACRKASKCGDITTLVADEDGFSGKILRQNIHSGIGECKKLRSKKSNGTILAQLPSRALTSNPN